MRYGHPIGDAVFLKEGGLISTLPSNAVIRFTPDWDTLKLLPPHYLKIVGDAVVEKTQGEKDTGDASRLSEFKTAKILEIRNNTEAAMTRGGFTFDGTTFGITPLYRDLFFGLRSAVLDAIVSLPQDIPTQMGDKYSLTAPNATGFFTAFLGALKSYADDEATLTKAVVDASTKTELDAVVDNR